MPNTFFSPICNINFFRLGKTLRFDFNEEPIISINTNQYNNSENLRISFIIEHKGFQFPSFSFANINIHNPNANNYLSKFLLDENRKTGITIEFGYNSGATPEIIFSGVVNEVLNSYPQPNNLLKLICTPLIFDIDKIIYFKKNETLAQVVQNIFDVFFEEGQINLKWGGRGLDLNSFIPKNLATKSYPKRTFVEGNFLSCVGQIQNMYDCRFFIDSNSVNIIDASSSNPWTADFLGPQLTISEENGLVGSPTFHIINGKVSFKTILNPSVHYNTRIRLNSRNPKIVGAIQTLINIANSRLKSNYVLPQTITHSFDSRGKNCYTDLNCVAVKPFINTI